MKDDFSGDLGIEAWANTDAVAWIRSFLTSALRNPGWRLARDIVVGNESSGERVAICSEQDLRTWLHTLDASIGEVSIFGEVTNGHTTWTLTLLVVSGDGGCLMTGSVYDADLRQLGDAWKAVADFRDLCVEFIWQPGTEWLEFGHEGESSFDPKHCTFLSFSVDLWSSDQNSVRNELHNHCVQVFDEVVVVWINPPSDSTFEPVAETIARFLFAHLIE